MIGSQDLFPNCQDFGVELSRARQVAEGVTTRAIKLRLLELALEYDKLADGTESATRPPTDLSDIE